MRAAEAAGAPRSYARGARVAAIGIAATGLVTQAYFSLASHSLGPYAYGGLSLAWTAIFLTCSILYRPVEQLLSRTIADREARGVAGAEHLRVATTIQLALVGAFVVAALALRGPLEDGLFGGSSALYGVFVVAAVAYAASYFARGFLAGTRRLGLYGALVFAESAARFAFALLAAVGVARSQSFVALGMAAAPIASLAVVPWALRRHVRRRPADGTAAGDFTLAQGSGFAAAVLVIMVAEQAFLNAGPLLVKAGEGARGTALAGFAFNVVLIARAPLQLFQAIQTAILPHLTELAATAARADFRRSVAVTLRAIAAFGALLALALLAVGPPVMRVLFGDKGFAYDRLGLVAMGAGLGLYLAGATLSQAALAAGHARRASVCWVAAAAAYLGFLLVPGWHDRVLQLELGFLLGSVVLSATLFVLYRRSPARG